MKALMNLEGNKIRQTKAQWPAETRATHKPTQPDTNQPGWASKDVFSRLDC